MNITAEVELTDDEKAALETALGLINHISDIANKSMGAVFDYLCEVATESTTTHYKYTLEKNIDLNYLCW